jgi:hypothetical protein
MRKIYLALSMIAILSVMFSISAVKAYTTEFLVSVDPYGLGWTELPGVNPVYGEAIYKDLNLPGTTGNARVTAGDVRLTTVPDQMGGYYPAGSVVTTSDTDFNALTYGAVARWGNVKHTQTGATADRYDFGEHIYRDMDSSNTVSINDVRFSNVPGYKVNSVVADLDTDLGLALTTFKGTLAGAYERFTDNLVEDTGYNFARLSVDILWNTDILDNTADGMRGYQLFCAVNPDVLTPLGWSGAEGGYVLMDFLGNVGSSLTTAIVGAVNPDNLDVSEQFLGALDPPTGAGDLFAFGRLITLTFIPQSELDWSPLDLLDTSLGYQDAGTLQWHTVTLTDGNYNVPLGPEFPLGIGFIMILAPAIPIMYLWRTRRKVVR